ncbi:MAG: group 1 truncated hemoglobin [Candidatus Nitronauta litoralis]|uniref:Group 1 truncated hemoglobin n=1 Tax=Candidatus Nitronauta litoralis TaxID=2705533 RepID=A0A7T0G1Z8_9BACT|nr:MAG: group 1 truncated hemoglobin [Candidatus Nitronauta litoralis]
MEANSLLEDIGGRPTLERVHKVFYDKLYAHPWLKQFFEGINQKVIEDQQTDFMVSNMGGGKVYSGRIPSMAHRHMFITEELFDLRSNILKDSLEECNVPVPLAEKWIRIDYAFKHSLVKSDVSECEPNLTPNGYGIIDIKKP